METRFLRTLPALLLLLASTLTLSAQSLEQAAARERGRREGSLASPSRAFTDDDLGTDAARRPPEVASQLPSGQPAAVSDPLPNPPAPGQNAYGRHWASAEAYVKQCEQRLRAAKSWLTGSEASLPSAATPARLALDRAAGALERAEAYRDQALLAARLASSAPVGLP